MSKLSLLSLLEEAKKGNISVDVFLKAFTDKYYSKVFTIASAYSKSTQDAEDITQDVFVKKFLKFPLSTFEKGLNGDIDKWVYVVVKRFCFTYLRLNKKYVKQQDSDEISEAYVRDSSTRCIDTKIDIESLLGEMPGLLSDVFLLIDEGFKYKEIAGKLSITEGSIKMMVARFRKKQ